VLLSLSLKFHHLLRVGALIYLASILEYLSEIFKLACNATLVIFLSFVQLIFVFASFFFQSFVNKNRDHFFQRKDN
jgi:hypothetical protein